MKTRQLVVGCLNRRQRTGGLRLILKVVLVLVKDCWSKNEGEFSDKVRTRDRVWLLKYSSVLEENENCKQCEKAK